jgi:hypothetical protein
VKKIHIVMWNGHLSIYWDSVFPFSSEGLISKSFSFFFLAYPTAAPNPPLL